MSNALSERSESKGNQPGSKIVPHTPPSASLACRCSQATGSLDLPAGHRDSRRLSSNFHGRSEGLRRVGQAFENIAGPGAGRRRRQAARVQKLVARVRIVHVWLPIADIVQDDGPGTRSISETSRRDDETSSGIRRRTGPMRPRSPMPSAHRCKSTSARRYK
jgi:hypothetical protein